MAKKAILVGIGTWGEWWCRDFLPPNIADGLVTVEAVVNPNPERFAVARRYLELTPDQCYTDCETAFRERKADFCIIVTPPSKHELIVDLAVKYGLDILSEKPIADTLEKAVRIAAKVRAAGRKMAVTMSHRFDQDKTTLRRELRSQNWGNLDYLVGRFTCDCRQFGSWGECRHRMKDPLMLEGAVHHLDLLADMAGSRCISLYAQNWRPEWAQFQGDCNALVTMTFENGIHAVYEGAKSNATTLNKWANEYIRAECENGTLILDRRRLEGFAYQPQRQWREAAEGQGKEIPLMQQKKWANAWLLEQFVRWLEGGEEMETEIGANLQSVALIFAAIQSSRTGQAVNPQELLEKAGWKKDESKVGYISIKS